MTRSILIFGLPRSGTTWLGKIFDSHPETLYRHEPDAYPRLEKLPRFPDPKEADTYKPFIETFIANLPRLNTASVSAKLPLFTKSYRSRARHHMLQAGVIAAKLGARVHTRIPVIGARADHVVNPPVLVWKSIESIGRMGLIMNSLDRARGIHLIRHPCGQINSVLRGERQAEFSSKTPSSEYYGVFEKLVKTPAAKRRGVTLSQLQRQTPEERLAWLWVLINEKVVNDGEGMNSTQLVRYEDLCREPLTVTRNLFDFACLDWNDQTEAFVRQSTGTDKKAYYSVFKNPIHSAERWREELDRDVIARILDVLKQSSLANLYETAQVSAA